ncbi:MAG: hypothetical protein HY897_21190 [Deltaproteobacteria bacterium]|nr:hypothetical protein [Deltaproteobacteria bacterium]
MRSMVRPQLHFAFPGVLAALAVACADASAPYDTGSLVVERDASGGAHRDGGADGRPETREGAEWEDGGFESGDASSDSSEWFDVSDQSDGSFDGLPPDAGETDVLANDDGGTEDALPSDSGGTDAGSADSGESDAGTQGDADLADSAGGDDPAFDAGAQDEDPIVFVHGWLWNAKDWQDFIDYFKGVGYPEDFLAAIQFSDTAGSNVKNARDELAPFVDAVLQKTGRQRVDIVGHSMAGLSVRLYILKYGGKDTVRDVFLLAPTNHGGTEACLVTWMGEGAKEMCPDYAAQDKSVNSVQWDLNGDPDTEDIDETPFCAEHGTGELFYTTIRDGKDTFAVPHDTACLNQKSKADCSHPLNLDPGFDLGHFGLLHDARVFEIVEQNLRAHNPGRPR